MDRGIQRYCIEVYYSLDKLRLCCTVLCSKIVNACHYRLTIEYVIVSISIIIINRYCCMFVHVCVRMHVYVHIMCPCVCKCY